MRPGQIVLRDLSTWYYSVREPLRPRAMRILVASEEPPSVPERALFRDCPQSFAGCIIAAQYGL